MSNVRSEIVADEPVEAERLSECHQVVDVSVDAVSFGRGDVRGLGLPESHQIRHNYVERIGQDGTFFRNVRQYSGQPWTRNSGNPEPSRP